MPGTSQTERRLDQLSQELAQMRRSQQSQRLPRAEANIVKIIGSDVPPRSTGSSFETPGTGVAVPYYIDSAGNLQPHKDDAGNNRTVAVRNPSTKTAKVGEMYATSRMPDGKRILDIPGGQSTPTWIDFVLTGPMSGSGEAPATVTTIRGDRVYDFSGASPVEIVAGSTVTVYDDNNLWRDLVANCNGKAIHRYVDGNPVQSQFAIHSSTRPLNKVLARLVDKLTAAKDQIQVKPYHATLSQPPFVTAGPEWNLPADQYLTTANDWKLHSDSDNVVELERVYAGLQVKDLTAGAPVGSTVTVYWRVTRVLDPFPRKIVGTLAADMTSSQEVAVNVIKEFGGVLGATVQGHVLPGFLDNVVSVFGLFGWKAGDQVVLEYSEADDKYYIIDVIQTASVILGTVVADFATTDATFQINNVEGVNGATPPGTTFTISNIHGWDGKVGHKVKAEKNVTQTTWQSYQKDC